MVIGTVAVSVFVRETAGNGPGKRRFFAFTSFTVFSLLP